MKPKPDKATQRRIFALGVAADVLEELQRTHVIALPPGTLPAVAVLRATANELKNRAGDLAELAASSRKPPQRVAQSSRRAVKAPARTRVSFTDRTHPVAPLDSMHTTRAQDVGDYDMEQAQELADRLGDDVPDGSD